MSETFDVDVPTTENQPGDNMSLVSRKSDCDSGTMVQRNEVNATCDQSSIKSDSQKKVVGDLSDEHMTEPSSHGADGSVPGESDHATVQGLSHSDTRAGRSNMADGTDEYSNLPMQSKKPSPTGFRYTVTPKKVSRYSLPLTDSQTQPPQGLNETESEKLQHSNMEDHSGPQLPSDAVQSSAVAHGSISDTQHHSSMDGATNNPSSRGIPPSITSPNQRPTGTSMISNRPISVAGAAGNLKQTNQLIHRTVQNQNDVGHNMIRELKVEDALQYLDQVKLEFGDNPTVYNTFLEIMKQFKSQELDTPGVIMKVSSLFRGYNKLILGFNTFLPDGYKIELKDLENMSARSELASLPQRNQKLERIPSAGGQPNNVPFRSRRQPQYWQSMDYDARNGKQSGIQSMLSHDQMMPSHDMNLPSSMRQSNVDSSVPVASMQGRLQTTGQVRPDVSSPPMSNRQTYPMSHVSQLPDQKQMVSNNNITRGFNHAMGQSAIQNVTQQHRSSLQVQQPQVEFDAAIAYVTTIKQRFAHDPRTYQAFLEILHTYQQEQRGIREVLEQVSALFSEHPDLLREFAHFLPEAVQEQAREKLQRAASEAEARMPMAMKTKVNHLNKGSSGPIDSSHGSTVSHQLSMGKQGFKPSVIDMSSVSSPDSRRKFPYGTDGLLPSQAPNQQDSFVYNAGVERQFFDLVKEALTSSYSRNGETAWIEFRKCLDTYTQEIISRSEMLSIMEDLLGKKHVELFEEFKCILSAAGSSTTYGQEDSWHSVPLSEIEFNRCRRCTPSYRALPRDYPNPPCSDRHDEDATVLNDTWVSLPVGSEENTRFRHMRKNQYEEVLFRCEDERFEIDMVIDSNCSTLHRLEPIAEEILFLQQQFRASKEQGTVAENMVFRYYFDPSILSTIHKNCIIRIYGDAGPEMLDLLLKNPAVVVPIIVKRLRQKDKEFREAKEILNRRWKDLAEANYFRSVDHRNLTWRAADKRATSTRTLLTDIKDRAANNGSESEGCSLSRRDKAKEEHGAFYDVTMGRYLGRKMDLITLPKPSKSVFTPHYYICYDNASWAQQDACRILLYMVERGSTSPVDKERCYKLWRDLFGPFFGLSMMWMHSPTALNSSNDIGLTTVVKHDNADEIDDDNDSIEDDGIIGNLKVKEEVMRHGHTAIDKNESSILEHQPIPVGAHLSTLYGEGILVEYRRLERIYVVELAFGAKAFLRPNAVLCSVLHPERSSITEKLRAEDKECLVSSDDRLCFGPQSLYLFFRLHHILVQRLIVARNLAYTVDDDPSLRTIIEKLPVSKCLDRGKQRYGAYLSLLYSLADGGQSAGLQQLSTSSSEGVKYEDRVRSMLGHGAFELTTVDKLLTHILKNLQILANDEVFQSMIQVFRRHLLSKKFKPNAFRQEVAMLSEGEPIYAFQHCTIPKSDRAVVYMELLGSLSDVDDNEKNPLQTQDMAKRKNQPDVVMSDKENPKRTKTN